MYISRTRHVKTGYPCPGCLDFSRTTYDLREASRISHFCRKVLSLGLKNLKVLVLHRILLDDDMLQIIGLSELEQLDLISCWWDLKDVSYYSPSKIPFRRLHITHYDDAFVTDGQLLHSKLEELVLNAHLPSPRPLSLDATNCDELKHV